ncbi:hypothetical protein BGX38DRAFT_26755 [Terfezia claveryi]|nr:hypothetical protein BGX38DRAFT_26755 [Terfezia claveryi]
MDDHDEEEYVGPEDWRKHKPYGAGISQRRINFVKAGSAPATPATAKATTTAAPDTPALVTDATPTAMAIRTGDAELITSTEGKGGDEEEVVVAKNTYPVCDICSLPIHDPRTHQHTLAHQSSLPHSELPHHLDRSSQGLKYLVSRGWDPDKKVGLGKEGAEGDRVPMAVRLKPKHDTVGLRVKIRDRDRDKRKAKGSSSGPETKVVKKLDAKSARKEAERERERRKALAEYLNRS